MLHAAMSSNRNVYYLMDNYGSSYLTRICRSFASILYPERNSFLVGSEFPGFSTMPSIFVMFHMLHIYIQVEIHFVEMMNMK